MKVLAAYRDRRAVERVIGLLHAGSDAPEKDVESLVVEARLFELIGERGIADVLRKAASLAG